MFHFISCNKENERWFVCVDALLLKKPLQQKVGDIFLTVEEYGSRCERQLGSQSGCYLSYSVSQESDHFWIHFFFFLVVDRIKENCYSFLENMTSTYKTLLPQCWAIFVKIWLLFPGKETEFTLKNTNTALFCVHYKYSYTCMIHNESLKLINESTFYCTLSHASLISKSHYASIYNEAWGFFAKRQHIYRHHY